MSAVLPNPPQKADRCLSVRIEHDGAVFHCWHCDWSGGVSEASDPEALTYATNVRKISRATLERLGVGSDTAFFPELNRRAKRRLSLRATAVVNWKAAAFPVKAFTSKKGGKLQFWNLARVIGSQTVYITEGEWDARRSVEAGIPVEQVLSVPNGARARIRRSGRASRLWLRGGGAGGRAERARSGSFGAVTTTVPAALSGRYGAVCLARRGSTSSSGLRAARTPMTCCARMAGGASRAGHGRRPAVADRWALSTE